jgi:hypothetical protein
MINDFGEYKAEYFGSIFNKHIRLQFTLLMFFHYLFNNTTACFHAQCVEAPTYNKQSCSVISFKMEQERKIILTPSLSAVVLEILI